MRLKYLIVICILYLLICMTGCSYNTSTSKEKSESANYFLYEDFQEESNPTQDKGVSSENSKENEWDSSVKATSNKFTYIEVPMNSFYRIDLDGDGKEDKVNVSMKGEEVIVTVNNTYYIADSIFAYTTTDNYAIVDINNNDNIKEIIVSDYGPSADYTSSYFYYNGSDIIDMGITGGLHNDGIHIHGDGTLTAMFRFSIFQTWFGEKDYRLNQNHQLAEIPQKLYKTNYQLTTQTPIQLLTDADVHSSKFTIEANKTINLIACDNKEWILVKDENGKEGWFKSDLTTLGIPADLYIMEIFEGVNLAD